MRCYSPNRDSYGVLAANKDELAARAFERVSVLVLVVVLGAGAVSWLSARLRRAAAGGAGRVLAPLPALSAGKAHRCWCQLIVTRCGGAVSWLRRLRTFLFQPVACQQVVGFCLAIWVYAGVVYIYIWYPPHISPHIFCQTIS